MALLDNLEKIRYRLRKAAERVGRNPDDVHLVAVTKYAPLEAVRRLLESGAVSEVGESRVQDAQAKKASLGPLAGRVRWRFIGHLQTNKARKAVELFDCIDSLDTLHLAEALQKALEGAGKTLPVLVQIKLTGRETQSGLAPEQAEDFLRRLAAFPRLIPSGLLSIAPRVAAPDQARPSFRAMKLLFDRCFSGRPGAQLSMGMSADFEVAVEEGATHVRIGTQIFSP